MKLLVTGGCGFLGSNLVAHALRTEGNEVAVLDNLCRLGSKANLGWLRDLGEFYFAENDIRDSTSVDSVIGTFRPEVVYHLAGQVAMTTSIADPMTDFQTNALGTLNILESVRRHTPEAIVVYSSTNKVYGDLEQHRYVETELRYVCADKPNGFDESTPLEFHSPYGCSKGSADQYVLDYARIFDLRTVVFRHSSMYGGRQFSSIDQGWIGWFCQQAMNQMRGSTDPFTICGSGKQVRDVLHAEDMIRLYRAAVTHIDRAAGQAFNIGGGIANSLSLLELFENLARVLKTELRYNRIASRESDQKVFVADIRKAKRLLDWEPTIGKEEGLQQMLKWTEATSPVTSQ
jgi:CDP-paratose 2-epimerase